MSPTEEEVFDAVFDTLLPQATYISAGPDDSTKYFIPPEVFEVLVWSICNVMVPVLTGVASSVISDRLKAKGRKGDGEVRALRMPPSDVAAIQVEVNESLRKLPATMPTFAALSEARDQVKAVLLANGFPAEIATSTATNAVDAVVEARWKESGDS